MRILPQIRRFNLMQRLLKYLSFGLLAVLIIAMMAATVLEKIHGTPFAFQWIYHNPVFIVLWAVVAIAGLIYLVKRGVPKKLFTMCLHLGFVLILAGALVTHLFGESGSIHLRQDMTEDHFELENGGTAQLPFSIRLDKFDIDFHSGSKMPSDYRSAITFLPEGYEYGISMNNIAKYQGYRFYQADYDQDGLGSILAVSHDPWGVGITYAGYLLLLISIIGFFFQKDTRFRAALKKVTGATSLAVALFLLPSVQASAKPDAASNGLGNMYLYYGHRVCSFDNYLHEKGFEAALESLPKVKIFPIADSTGRVSWYSSQDELPEQVYDNPDLWSFIKKAPEAVIESVREGNDAEAAKILGGIRDYQVKVAQDVLPTPKKEKAERLYTRLARPKVPFMLCLSLGILLFLAGAILMSRQKRFPRWMVIAGAAIALAAWLYLTLVIALRWYVSGTGPYVGRYNVMMLMAWFSTLAILLFHKRFPLIEPLGFLLAGFTMLMASRSGTNIQIMPLMPVLRSPLLSIHVVSMMMSYTLFGLVAINGILGVVVRNRESQELLRDVSLVILYPAVFLITFGTFLGAVWANISWGSYWAWDPKETWALVTLLVYSFALHGSSIKAFRNPRFFHWFTIVAFICVLVTYFGVNLLLGGMHSYGS